MAYSPFINRNTAGIGEGAAKSGDVMTSTAELKAAVQATIDGTVWTGSAGDAMRGNGQQIFLQLTKAENILRNKQEALTLTQNTTVEANEEATTLFHVVNPGTTATTAFA